MQEQKSLVLLVVIALSALLTISQSGFLAQASVDYWNAPAVKEAKFGRVCGYDNSGGVAWSIDIKAVIPTEKNGDWALNETYEVSWEITLTCVNQTKYPNDSFSIEFFNFSNPFNSAIAENIGNTNSSLYGQRIGYSVLFYFNLTPQNTGNYTFVSAFSINVFNKDRLDSTMSWTQNTMNPPIYINVESPKPSPQPSVSSKGGIITLRYQDQFNEILNALPIVLIIIAFASSLLALVKRAKAYDESKKAGAKPVATLEDNQDIELATIHNDAPVLEADNKNRVLLRCRNAWLSDTTFYYCRNFWPVSDMAEASVNKNGSLAIRFNNGNVNEFRLAPNDAEMNNARWSGNLLQLYTTFRELDSFRKKRSEQWAITINMLISKQKSGSRM